MVENLIFFIEIIFENSNFFIKYFPLKQFTSSPVCCPSRASLLSGQYAHNHRTTNNSYSGGCYGERWRQQVENRTFPVHFLENGYNTFYGGKYLNQVSLSPHIRSMGFYDEVVNSKFNFWRLSFFVNFK